jgi:hypothetical protein
MMKPGPRLDAHAGKLLGLLKEAGIDAMPVRDDAGQNYTQQLVLFFDDGDKFVISVDPRTPIVWLKGVHV